MTTWFANVPIRAADAALRTAIVALALGTAYIHSTLGGLLFTLNALGYLGLAFAMIVPLGVVSRFRGLVRLALAAYAATTIAAWAVQGPFYSTAYLAKGIEVALIALLVLEAVRARDPDQTGRPATGTSS
jgi:hypothetical protein